MELGLAPIDGLVDFDKEEQREAERTKSSQDALGNVLQKKWEEWSLARRDIEEEWLKDLRAFNQQNDPDANALSQFHKHIYVGVTRTKCHSAYSRVTDLVSNDHWSIDPTPVPETPVGDEISIEQYREAMQQRAKLMEQEMKDQLLAMDYDDALDSAILEGCIIGTGIIKGIFPGVKRIQQWGFVGGLWDVIDSEIPFPQIGLVSAFDVYPDPYATTETDMSGVFERHVLNRKQFSALKDDAQFDADTIDEILRDTEKGNHTSLYHETERRKIAGISDTTQSTSERYDVLEYWGQVSGKLLQQEGIEEAEEETETYWANVWTCAGKTLLAKIMPMKKQRIPYNFFIYQKVPHQFWGISPARMMRDSQATLNASVRALLDNMAIASGPQVEVNVSMLKHGEDPRKMDPWRVWLRDSGDPAEPAVRFNQPNSLVSELIAVADQFRKYADEETSLPSYTHGDQIPGLNKTASGMSMLMGAAQVSIKSVVTNLENHLIRPLLKSLFDWNMQWNEREDIKGDMDVEVKLSKAIMAKELQSQRLVQYLQLTANPIDLQFVDRRYLLKEAANALEIDGDKAVPNPEQYGQEPSAGIIDPMQQAGMGAPGAAMAGPPGAEPQGVGNLYAGQDRSYSRQM